MNWSDEGIILSVRKHGESSSVVTLLTRNQGRHAGLVRSAASPQKRGIFHPGNLVQANWRGRLPEQLGSFSIELSKPYAATIMEDPARLAALNSVCALVIHTLPERDAHPVVFERTVELVATLADTREQMTDGSKNLSSVICSLASKYISWEIMLLQELGFGLDLTECAATGRQESLAYVSPKTGRAVSAEAGQPYKNKLLPLPQFLVQACLPDPIQLRQGLHLTEFFLKSFVFAPQGRKIPESRLRLASVILES